jgi:hypothetical protein
MNLAQSRKGRKGSQKSAENQPQKGARGAKNRIPSLRNRPTLSAKGLGLSLLGSHHDQIVD